MTNQTVLKRFVTLVALACTILLATNIAATLAPLLASAFGGGFVGWIAALFLTVVLALIGVCVAALVGISLKELCSRMRKGTLK